VDIKVNSNFSFTFIAAHLKSRRPVPEADEAEMRLEEAKALRKIVDADLAANPRANLIVLGDFNDNPNSASTKEIIGRGRFKLIDTRPAERNGDDAPSENSRYEPRRITWTHHYGVEDSFSRIDYIMLSPGLAKVWVTNETYVLAISNWGVGSDHRPLVATFETGER
jgi:endonuclease/exonuclease/phosphatase family metal-dependent hydrolase